LKMLNCELSKKQRPFQLFSIIIDHCAVRRLSGFGAKRPPRTDNQIAGHIQFFGFGKGNL
jgi:hypothetical protein